MSEPENNGDAPKLTPEEQAKADRATKIIYGAMIFFILLPFIVLWIKK